MQRQALAEAISTAMSKGQEPLIAGKETKNRPTKYRGTRDGKLDGWIILMKRHLEKAHAKQPLQQVRGRKGCSRAYIVKVSRTKR